MSFGRRDVKAQNVVKKVACMNQRKHFRIGIIRN